MQAALAARQSAIAVVAVVVAAEFVNWTGGDLATSRPCLALQLSDRLQPALWSQAPVAPASGGG